MELLPFGLRTSAAGFQREIDRMFLRTSAAGFQREIDRMFQAERNKFVVNVLEDILVDNHDVDRH